MANNLIPEELNALIQQYLTDGVLTDKERQVILNKAEKMGLDRDEIDLYLDAEVQKIDQQTDAAVRKQKGKACPYCGAPIPQLADKCPACGQFITPEASSELQEIFDNLEEALVDLKSGNDIEKSKATVERYARKAKMYYGSNPKIQKLLIEVENETLAAEKKAKSMARKNALVSVLTYNKKLTAAVIVVLIGFMWWGISVLTAVNNKPEIDAQYNSLMEQIDALEEPNETNFKDVQTKLLKIHWKDVDDSDYNDETKYKIRKAKENVADRIMKVYEKLDIYDEAPDQIRWPTSYMTAE